MRPRVGVSCKRVAHKLAFSSGLGVVELRKIAKCHGARIHEDSFSPYEWIKDSGHVRNSTNTKQGFRFPLFSIST